MAWLHDGKGSRPRGLVHTVAIPALGAEPYRYPSPRAGELADSNVRGHGRPCAVAQSRDVDRSAGKCSTTRRSSSGIATSSCRRGRPSTQRGGAVWIEVLKQRLFRTPLPVFLFCQLLAMLFGFRKRFLRAKVLLASVFPRQASSAQSCY